MTSTSFTIFSESEEEFPITVCKSPKNVKDSSFNSQKRPVKKIMQELVIGLESQSELPFRLHQEYLKTLV